MRLSTESDIHFTISFDKGFHAVVWKAVLPLILAVTLCACVLHWAGVL